MKLNLGCGFNRLEGYLNVDSDPLCLPDLQVNLEHFPWPWADNSASEVMAYHSLEHMGATTESWIGIIREIWRVCRNDALVKIVVPHPRHDNFLSDPTHVRAITPHGVAMFDQRRNLEELKMGSVDTKLGLMNRVDIEILETAYRISSTWQARLDSGEISKEQLEQEMLERNNICSEVRILGRVVKPGRGESWLAERAQVIRSQVRATTLQ